MPKIALWEDAQTISYESTGALYRRRVFSARSRQRAAQWDRCCTFAVLDIEAPEDEMELLLEAVSAGAKGARGRRRELLDGLADRIEGAVG